MQNDLEKILPETSPLAVAYANTAAARAALADDELVGANVDARSAATLAAGGFANAAPLLADVARRMPTADVALVRTIPERADALLYSQAVVESEVRDALAIAALLEEGTLLRDELTGDLKAAAARGYVDGRRLAELRLISGYRPVASDLVVLVRVAHDAWATLEGRSLITAEKLARAGQITAELWHAIGELRRAPVPTSTANNDRRRALTLLIRAYDELERILDCLRWDEGDAEAIAPSLYGPRRRRASKHEDEDPASAELSDALAAPPAMPAMSGVATPRGVSPSVSVASASAAESLVAPGMPGENPFGP